MIGRILLYTIIAALGIFVLTSTFALEHGGEYKSAQPPVSVHDLLLQPEAYRGKTVTTEGILRHTSETQRYEVVDAESQAILVRWSNESTLNRLLGDTVVVIGRFEIDEEDGVYIDVHSMGLAE